ncbi:ribose transport system substrate-binding protein [Streptoalloteichus tenebrarius]|uniref:Ribose transport system substrate-binding protein n=1 Tax=Streptoalloteichus tenebrarius (strain ATCC 17920 / DSM 40477 / JCM 4838 / CBS 697.72 / NBRC 16177 / NCIMB 11028 / NRRL B-12390 / A12253. 1 / ISP 5477) TaxID=1933 RepID=A0ABT1HS97_STRSD|nr:ABC transporter substrate-binding protein [Streptoalloteichus tenebrarius]MCP2258353.1 ribose transport system substrate-binding protein [Streptoalloteichus tenebrarius]BFF03520.1 ABC transporter substrate-binding protein [Streptoalloteichus tenebrarius]
MAAGRRAHAVVAALATASVLTACGGGGVEAGSGGKPKLYFLPGVKDEPFYVTMECGAKEEAAALGYEFVAKAPAKFDADLQSPLVEDARKDKAAAVVIAPTDERKLIAPLKDLDRNGTKVVEVDTAVIASGVSASRVASDNAQGGRKAAETLIQLVGGRGKVLVLDTTLDTSSTNAREKGFAEVASANSKINYLGKKYTDNDPAKAARIVTQALTETPDLAGIFTTNLNTTEGAAAALRAANKVGQVKLVGFDASPQQVEDLRAGVVQALIAQDPAGIGRQGVQQVVAAVEKKPTKGEIKVDVVPITRDTMDQNSKYFYRKSC